jgi:type III secretion protein R
MQSLILASLVIATVPTLLCVATCYLKISIVLGVIKSALGTNSTPGVMITSALSLLLTIYVMKPVFTESYTIYINSNQKNWDLIKDQSARDTAIKIIKPFSDFFEKHSGALEKKFFDNLNTHGEPEKNQVSLFTVLPAFTLTELREAFQMSCFLLLPFLVVDLLVATLLGGMGLYMVSPISIALPLKLLLFVASDCWLVLSKGLILSYQ